MGKYYENSSIFTYTWVQIVTAFWKRYPNPYSTHVLSEDTLCRELRDDNCLYTKRILTKTNPVPNWGKAFVKSSIVAIIEESYIDLKNKTLTTYTRNIGFNRIMSITEKVIYSPPADPKDSTMITISKSKAWVDSGMFGFRRPIEAFGLERFRSNCSKAFMGFNHILQILYPNQVLTLSSEKVVGGNILPTKEKLKEKAKKASEIPGKSPFFS